jgi:hypothetical protein
VCNLVLCSEFRDIEESAVVRPVKGRPAQKG